MYTRESFIEMLTFLRGKVCAYTGPGGGPSTRCDCKYHKRGEPIYWPSGEASSGCPELYMVIDMLRGMTDEEFESRTHTGIGFWYIVSWQVLGPGQRPTTCGQTRVTASSIAEVPKALYEAFRSKGFPGCPLRITKIELVEDMAAWLATPEWTGKVNVEQESAGGPA